MAGVDIAALSGLRVEGDAHRAGEAGAFLSVSAGDWHSCGLRADRSVACWGVVTGHPGRGPSQNTAIIVGGPARPEVPRGSFASISAGEIHSCGLKTDGSLACWGNYQPGEGGTPSDSFTYVSVGDQYTCGVRTDGSVACWRPTSSSSGWAPPSDGSFTYVDTGLPGACGVREDGSITCWGSREIASVAIPLGRSFPSASRVNTCVS